MSSKSRSGSGMIRVISGAGIPMWKSSRQPTAGCVAVQRTTVQLKFRTSSPRAASTGRISPGGIAWASSRMRIELASRWSLRQGVAWLAKSDSKSCTLVVTISGAAQFSVAS